MVPTQEHLEASTPLQCAVPYLSSPDGIVKDRNRGNYPGSVVLNRETMRRHDVV